MRVIEALRRSEPGVAPLGALWMLVFAFTAGSAFVIQFVILGSIMPQWSNGVGLLLNTDSVAYHDLAVELAQRIHREGWRMWELSPKDQFPIGFYGAIYALTLPAPWMAIPLNAVAHAFSALLIIQMMRLLVDDWRIAALAALPYVVFPSASMWYSQLLKDGYFNLGALLFCYGWVRLAIHPGEQRVWRDHMLSAALIITGFAITGAVRPHTLTLLYWASVFMATALLGHMIYCISKKIVTFRQVWASMIIPLVFPVLLIEIKNEAVERDFVPIVQTDMKARLSSVEKSYWRFTPWLPKALDRRLATLAGVRKGYISNVYKARSTIDQDIEFHDAADLVAYIPRAIQIGFLAPFPRLWFEPGSTPASTAMRRVSMVEMSIVYGALVFLPFALWRWRDRVEMWVAVIFCGSLVLVYAMGTPNVGTLYRVRYVYLMPFVALGVLAAASLWRDGWKRRRVSRGRASVDTGGKREP